MQNGLSAYYIILPVFARQPKHNSTDFYVILLLSQGIFRNHSKNPCHGVAGGVIVSMYCPIS